MTIILDKSTISEYKSENKENHMKLYEGSIGSWYLVEQVRVDERPWGSMKRQGFLF